MSVDGQPKKTQLFKEVEFEQLKVSVVFSYDSPDFFTVEPFVDGGFRDHLWVVVFFRSSCCSNNKASV